MVIKRIGNEVCNCYGDEDKVSIHRDSTKKRVNWGAESHAMGAYTRVHLQPNVQRDVESLTAPAIQTSHDVSNNETIHK